MDEHHAERKLFMKIAYTQIGDYFLPNIAVAELPAEERIIPLGRYGKMRRAFLREHCPIYYSILVLKEQLFSHLREVDAIANERRKNVTSECIIVKEIICEI